jgi:hypothetical protein
MDNKKNKELCLSLMKADTEEEVIQLLRQAGYWDNPAVWRYYGDNENNFSTIGSQQSHPEAALVEKLVNSVDARLMGECLGREIDPEGVSAPKTTREAVARFFEDNPTISTAGLMREWPDSKRTEISRGITLAATGAMPSEGKPCLTIADNGEGQMPRMMPNTFLSLTNKSNKLRIPFVQGKFNMGGTGVLRFCGQHNLELILSRRDPVIADGALSHPSDSDWGFTIVRRENPEGNRRSSVYTYLAPVDVGDSHGKNGEVLHFSAKAMPIFPDGREAYGRDSKWGTLIKLYEYSLTGSKSHILRKKGLMGRIDLLMPDVALPIRFHECRPDYRGHEGSFETTLTGIGVRLDDDRADNLEPGFPSSCPMSIAGEQMTATIYAFKKGKSETYRRNEGIVFTINGQTHGHFTTDFFRRSRLGLSYLHDSILVIVDCSKLTGRAREDLFMNSRDRLSGGELRAEIEETLEGVLKQHSGLRELKERRRREEIEDKLEDSKPLEDVLESLLKQSPTLTKLFLQGGPIPNPFKTSEARGQEEMFEGKRYPTYFKFKGKDYGTEFRRSCHINTRCRVEFETDVQNDYFSRDIDQGEFSLFIMSDDHRLPVKNYTLNLQNGIATLNLQLPANCRVGDELRFVAVVTDRTQIDPFINVFVLNVERPAEATSGPGGKKRERRKPSQDVKGDPHQMPLGIQLPKIIKVYENPGDDTKKGWQDMSPPFHKYSALRVINAGSSDEHGENGNGKNVYDFFLNVDNIFLKTEQKAGNHEPEMAEARFIYGMVLLGLSLLHQDVQEREPQSETEDGSDSKTEQGCIEDKVEELTKAVAPVLLPMIDYLGDLDLGNGGTEDTSGEAA